MWRLFDQNVALNQVIEAGRTICVGLKWVGEKQTTVFSEWEHGWQDMIEGVHAMMSEADGVITYNGDKFDLPILRGDFAEAGLPPPPPVPSIDVLKTTRTFKRLSSKLDYINGVFGIARKLDTGGFDLWRGVMDGNPAAQRKMARYCAQDVKALEALYLRVLPYIKTHPHLHGRGSGSCPNCGSLRIQSRGSYATRCFTYQRLYCRDCGGWHRGKGQKK